MSMTESTCDAFARDGFQLHSNLFSPATVAQWLTICNETLAVDSPGVQARSSHGHIYAARNLIELIPEVATVWQIPPLLTLLRSVLGDDFGLVRALFFDKPPERTWNLPWHKDTAIAVKQHVAESSAFSRPTTKAGVPHVIADDDVLREMLTLRIHLDEVTDENGPLRVIPGSHVSSDSVGVGFDHAVTIHAKAGDVLAMRPLISHASGPSLAGTKRHRRILHLEFAASERLPDGYEWHDFVKPTDR